MRLFLFFLGWFCVHRPQFRALLKPVPLVPVVLGLFALPASAAPVGCVAVSDYCTIGEAEQTIQGFKISRGCWEKRVVYSCPDARPGEACSPLSDDPDCSRTGAECIRRDGDGVCLREVNSFRCSAPKSGAGISLEGIVATALERDVDTPLRCGSTLYCPDGVCDDLGHSEASTDFGKAASWVGLLTQMGKEKDPDAVTLFRGDGKKCEEWPLGTKNCCSDDGWLLSVFGCSATEKILAEQRAARLTHFVGDYCSNDSFFGCLTNEETYCTFRSRFARVLQQQARAQLGIGWGSAEDPDCRSLSIEEIQQLDFSRINLSELYGDMVNQANTPNPGTVNQQLQDRINDYYRNGP